MINRYYLLAGAVLLLAASFPATAAVLFPNAHDSAELRLTERRSSSADFVKTSADLRHARRAPESGEWISLGTGVYVDDLSTLYGLSYPNEIQVEVFQHETQTGWYRLAPYAEGTCMKTISDVFGTTEDFMYINATAPDKVYLEPFIYPSGMEFSSLCVETGWNVTAEESVYGTLADNIITLPFHSVLAYDPAEGTYYACPNAGTVIRMPGAKDYTLSAFASNNCLNDEGNVLVQLVVGKDIPTLKVLVEPIYGEIDEDKYPEIIEKGQDFSGKTGSLVFAYTPAISHGISTVYVLGLDADGNVVGSASTFSVVNDNNAGDWEDAGTVEWTDGFLAPGYGETPGTYTSRLQADRNKAGRYRIVNPYYSTDFDKVLHGHDHCIYFDAADEENVVLEPSILGTNQSGEGAVWNYVDYFTSQGYTAELVAEALGVTYGKLESNVVTFPAGSLLLSERAYRGGAFMVANSEPLTMTLNEETGIGSIDSEDAAPIYINLQGLRIESPLPGHPSIRVAGGKSSIIIR